LQLLQILIVTAHYYAEANIPRCQHQHEETTSNSYRDCCHKLAKSRPCNVGFNLTQHPCLPTTRIFIP